MYKILCSVLWLWATASSAKTFFSYADIAEQAIPGVVNIRTKSYVRRDPHLDLYEFFMGGKLPRQESTVSLGSGVIITQDGQIITNYHVIKDASRIDILFANSKKLAQADVIGVDRKTDLALLKVNVSWPLTVLTLGDSKSLRVGDIAIAIGNPFGYSHTVTQGIISAKGRVIGAGPYDNFLQTDATIHPGNSGGPLLDLRGRVIGINTAVSRRGGGIGFAIPINLAKKIVADLNRHGKVRRPWVGIVGKNILSDNDLDQGVEQSGIYGVIIANLIVDAPAHQAGVRIGDLLMQFDHKKVFDVHALQRHLSQRQIGDQVHLRLYRRGQGYLNVKLVLEEVPRSRDLPDEADLF
ncbi:MAG: trypsin-like peptidase domain-containing protein [Zetaproteobacteria bacterium]|nr:trypsin-like peptidase domain-containing protein [Zetaproteobacteria bacterium]